MKVRMTKNTLKLGADVVVKVRYCQADALLTGLEPDGYNSGVLGWNWDVYNLGGWGLYLHRLPPHRGGV